MWWNSLGFLIENSFARWAQVKQLSCLLLVLLATSLHANAMEPAPPEYKLNAALLYKLSRFIDWPPTTGKTQPESFNICLLGRDNFGRSLDVLEERKVNGIPIAVHRHAHSTGIDSNNCQMLFISDSKQPLMASILRSFENQPILTVSNTSNFAKNGGMIQLVPGQKHIDFKINAYAALTAGLKIAAPLLELAIVVITSKNRDTP